MRMVSRGQTLFITIYKSKGEILIRKVGISRYLILGKKKMPKKQLVRVTLIILRRKT